MTTCFSQGSAATDLRGGVAVKSISSRRSFLNLTVKKLWNSVQFCRSYRIDKSGPLFETRCIRTCTLRICKSAQTDSPYVVTLTLDLLNPKSTGFDTMSRTTTVPRVKSFRSGFSFYCANLHSYTHPHIHTVYKTCLLQLYLVNGKSRCKLPVRYEWLDFTVAAEQIRCTGCGKIK